MIRKGTKVKWVTSTGIKRVGVVLNRGVNVATVKVTNDTVVRFTNVHLTLLKRL